MKRLYTLILAFSFLGLGRAFGQLSISPSDTFVYNGTLATMSDSHEQNGYFMNTSADTAIIYWHAISAVEDSTWQMSFCDPENCYYYSVGQGLGNYGVNHFTAAPGVSYQLRFGVTPYCVADSGKMIVQAWLGTDTQTMHYFAYYTGSCALAIQTVPTSNFRVYPIPVSSDLTVDGLSGLKNVTLTIYDVLGNPVVRKNVSTPGDLTSVNTDVLHPGVYFLTIESDGTKLLTKRIEKLD